VGVMLKGRLKMKVVKNEDPFPRVVRTRFPAWCGPVSPRGVEYPQGLQVA
jgi:hypothetical protein